MTLVRGSILLLDLDPTRGHEPQGMRPCIVVTDPGVGAIRAIVAVPDLTSCPAAG